MSTPARILLVSFVLGFAVAGGGADAGWNEEDPSTSSADDSEYLAISMMPDGGALLVGRWRGTYEGLDAGTGVRGFAQYRDPAGDVAWTQAVTPSEDCRFDEGRGGRRRAEPSTAYFVLQVCDDVTMVSLDATGVVATRDLGDADRVSTFQASPSGGVHVLATERSVGGGSDAWSLFVLDRNLMTERSHPVPEELVREAEDPWTDEAGLISNLAASNGDAWLIGVDPNGPAPADDAITLLRFAPGQPVARFEGLPDDCYSGSLASTSPVQGLQNLDGRLWITACSYGSNPDGGPDQFILSFDDVDGALVGRVPLPADLRGLERVAGFDVPMIFSNDGRLASTGNYTGRIVWRIDGELESTTWDAIALSGDEGNDSGAWLPSFDRFGDDIVAVGAAQQLSESVDSEGGVVIGAEPTRERALIERRELPALTAVTPARLLDTRSGQPTVDAMFQGTGRLDAGETVAVPITGRGGVSDDAAAVMVNVTAVEPATAGYVTLHPCDVERDETSALNFGAGTTVGNTVTSLLGGSGDLCVYASAATDLVIDVQGLFRPTPSFGPIAPARLGDSRLGKDTVDGVAAATGRLDADEPWRVPVADRAGIAPDARWLVANVTAVRPETAGFVKVYPCDEVAPSTSSLNFAAGQTTGNQVLVELDASGSICATSSTATDLTIDATAWLGDEAGFRTGSRLRYLDTRPDGVTFDGTYFGGGPIAAGSTLEFSTNIRAWEPDGRGGTRLLLLNVTAVQPESNGYFTVWPCGAISNDRPRPTASTLNFRAGENAGNSMVVPVPDGDGVLCLFTTSTSNIVIDLIARR